MKVVFNSKEISERLVKLSVLVGTIRMNEWVVVEESDDGKTTTYENINSGVRIKLKI